MRRTLRTCATVAALIGGAVALHADTRIKIATIAPDSSVWGKTLRELGDGWKRATNGRITVQVQASSGANEDTIIREIRASRRLQAAQVSAIALSGLDDAFNVFGMPMFFRSYEELEAVLQKLGPGLDARLEPKGVKVLHWGYAGWVHVFSQKPIERPDDLKKLKLFTSAGDPRLQKWYRQNGFNPVPTTAAQVLANLMTGMIEAVPTTPLSAQIFRWYEHAPYMMDLGFAPLIGATVIGVDTWRSIPAADQKAMLDEAQKVELRLRGEVPRLDKEAIAQMIAGKQLTVTTAKVTEWQSAADDLGTAMRGNLVPADVYDVAVRERNAFRSGTAARR